MSEVPVRLGFPARVGVLILTLWFAATMSFVFLPDASTPRASIAVALYGVAGVCAVAACGIAASNTRGFARTLWGALGIGLALRLLGDLSWASFWTSWSGFAALVVHDVLELTL
jgi:hypothetical protein